MNTSSSNCSIPYTELWLMVTLSSLAILSGVFTFVMVAHLKLCLKPMYRSVVYQVLLTIIASAIFIACGGILMYKGNIVNNTSEITFNLALALVYLQLILFYILLLFLIRHFNEVCCKMQRTLCSKFQWFFEHKYSADILGGIIFIILFLILAIFAIVQKDFCITTSTYTTQIVTWVNINIIVISIIELIIFILYCRVKKEMKPLFKKLIHQLLPFLGYPVVFVF